MKRAIGALPCLLLCANACVLGMPQTPVVSWDDARLWKANTDGKSVLAFASELGQGAKCFKLEYTLRGDYGYVEVIKTLKKPVAGKVPVVFEIKAQGVGDLEVKLVDADGSTFVAKWPLAGSYPDWTPVVVYVENTEYGWGGDEKFSGLAAFRLALVGKGKGTVWLRKVGLGAAGTKSNLPIPGPVLDPDRALPGIGFRQRRAAALIPQDPLVLAWMKQMQDTATPQKQLLPSMENDDFQTFNNALAAMAFMVMGEKERAQRILDFYAKATVRTNADPTLQNFFLNGQARGFFQAVSMQPKPYHITGPNDRWMGDMVWLSFAYKYHEKLYGPARYREISGLLKDLLLSWYTDDANGPGGYLRHGWLKSDTQLHEAFGHPEGNIDAYALCKLLGENKLAAKIKTWLARTVAGKQLPLDLYTWRTLAFGKECAGVLDIPDYDLRYRRIFMHNGRPVMGLYDHADISVTNSWLDGVGQMACAYIAVGNKPRGYFYANQIDPFLIDRKINGLKTRTVPFTANRTGGYGWVHLDRGFLSAVAWYVFAKNEFNPMTLESFKAE